MNTPIQGKILLAVDGSDQALEAVRYISTIVSPSHTQIVLFSVGTGFPKVFWAMNTNPLYRSKKTVVMEWLADQQLVIGEFKEKAWKILTTAGFSESAIHLKAQTQKTGVLKDIIQESYMDYDAVVVGKTGISRLKDLMFGSIAYKAARKIRHVPTIIVGGRPRSKKILIALDETIESMRGVTSVGALAGGLDPDVTLCHCFNREDLRQISTDTATSPQEKEQLCRYLKNKFKPCMDEATQRLMDAGISPDRIFHDYLFCKGTAISEIVKIASADNFGTIVVGRRGTVNFSQSHIHGRFSVKLFQTLKDMALWVVN